jgi:hypothetical protein
MESLDDKPEALGNRQKRGEKRGEKGETKVGHILASRLSIETD